LSFQNVCIERFNKTYRAEVFDYIELFYNPKRQHSSNDGLSPIEFEKRYALNG